jgi:hypothetical protein
MQDSHTAIVRDGSDNLQHRRDSAANTTDGFGTRITGM